MVIGKILVCSLRFHFGIRTVASPGFGARTEEGHEINRK